LFQIMPSKAQTLTLNIDHENIIYFYVVAYVD